MTANLNSAILNLAMLDSDLIFLSKSLTLPKSFLSDTLLSSLRFTQKHSHSITHLNLMMAAKIWFPWWWQPPDTAIFRPDSLKNTFTSDSDSNYSDSNLNLMAAILNFDIHVGFRHTAIFKFTHTCQDWFRFTILTLTSFILSNSTRWLIQFAKKKNFNHSHSWLWILAISHLSIFSQSSHFWLKNKLHHSFWQLEQPFGCHVGFRHCHLGFRHLVIFSQIHSKHTHSTLIDSN